MTKTQLLEIYSGNVSELARATGVSRQAVHAWPENVARRNWQSALYAAMERGYIAPDAAMRLKKA